MALSARTRAFLRRRLNVRQLALIAQLDESRSVIRAAQTAGMSQPAASTLLKVFEDAFEVPLFERHARGITPTPFGEIVARHARAILAEIEQVQEEIDTLKTGLSGQTTLGALLTPGTHLVPAAIRLLKQQHPGLLISVEIDSSRPLIEKLQAGRLDLVIARFLDFCDPGTLQFEPLGKESHAVIAAATHPLASAEKLQLKELLGQPWVLPPPGSVLREQLTALFQRLGLVMPRNLLQTPSLFATLGLLRHCNAVTPVPKAAVQPLIESGFLRVLIDDIGAEMGPFGLVTRRTHTLSPGAQVLADALRLTAGLLSPPAPRLAAGADADDAFHT